MKSIILCCLCVFPILLNAQKSSRKQANISKTSEIVCKTNFDGRVTDGSIEALIEAIQQGASVRVGWQLDFDNDNNPDLEHWIDANFITILNGHVFNQIDVIYQQAPKKEIPQVKIMPSNTMWTGVIGTNGKLIHRYVLEDIGAIEDPEMIERIMKRGEVKETMVATMWAVKR